MQDEIEVKFLNIEIVDVQARLQKVGAKLENPRTLMKRTVLDYPDQHLLRQKDSWVRVRDEGDKIKLTFKKVKEKEFGTAKEIEVEVSSYEDTVAIFENVELAVFSVQENYRETWTLEDCEIVIDEWPWLEPYIEIEGPSKKVVMDVAKKLSFDWEDAIFGSISIAYRTQYPYILPSDKISSLKEIKFDLPIPDWFVKSH